MKQKNWKKPCISIISNLCCAIVVGYGCAVLTHWALDGARAQNDKFTGTAIVICMVTSYVVATKHCLKDESIYFNIAKHANNNFLHRRPNTSLPS